MFAAEVGHQDGPFVNPEGWDRYKLFNKLTVALSPTSSLSFDDGTTNVGAATRRYGLDRS